MKQAVFAILCVGGLLSGCGGGGPGAVSDPAAGVFVGKITSVDGAPVTGAQVSVDGVEANNLTDSQGLFVVSDSRLAQPAATASMKALEANAREIVVVAPGFRPIVQLFDVEAGAVPVLEIARVGLVPHLTVTAPSQGQLVSVAEDCDRAIVTVEGFVDLESGVDSLLLDLVVVMDSSGSTGRSVFEGEVSNVLQAEKAAVGCLLRTLDFSRTRVSLVRFSDSASQLASFTSDLDTLLAAVESVQTADGGTNYEAAFGTTVSAFLNQTAIDESDAEEEGPSDEGEEAEALPRRRAVVFLTDGIPTTHGIPKNLEDNNVEQSATDRSRSIEAARDLGDIGAELYGYTIVTDQTREIKLSTLPHCVGLSGGGRYVKVDSPEELQMALCGESLSDAVQVMVLNETLGGEARLASLEAGGKFSIDVAVEAGADGTRLNSIVVTAVSFPGETVSRSASQVVEVTVLSADTAAGMSFDDIEEARRDQQLVIDRAALTTPTGGTVGNPGLQNILVSDFEDAFEVFGVESFLAHDVDDPEAVAVTVTVDVIYKAACYKSDFGYVVVDPDDMPGNYREALEGATDDNVFLNSGVLGSACTIGSIPSGSQRFQLEAAAGSVVIFFMLPNRTLAQYRANPRRGLKPVFTASYLNPGQFDQVLSYVADRGRTEPGASEIVVNPGAKLLLGFEDIAIASGGSDQDFGDLVVSVSAGVALRSEPAVCDE